MKFPERLISYFEKVTIELRENCAKISFTIFFVTILDLTLEWRGVRENIFCLGFQTTLPAFYLQHCLVSFTGLPKIATTNIWQWSSIASWGRGEKYKKRRQLFIVLCTLYTSTRLFTRCRLHNDKACVLYRAQYMNESIVSFRHDRLLGPF